MVASSPSSSPARPARPLPAVRGWRARGIASFLAFFFLSTYLPLAWTSTLAQWQLFDLSGLGTAWGALAGILVYEAGVWAWHRSMHASDFLWRNLLGRDVSGAPAGSRGVSAPPARA